MDRDYRLTSPTDFKRVRRTGKSYAHPLVVLIASPNQLGRTRFGVTTSRGLRKAIERNRAKRRLRHALQAHQESAHAGWDLVLIARTPLLDAPWPELTSAVEQLLRRAAILSDEGTP